MYISLLIYNIIYTQQSKTLFLNMQRERSVIVKQFVAIIDFRIHRVGTFHRFEDATVQFSQNSFRWPTVFFFFIFILFYYFIFCHEIKKKNIYIRSQWI